MRKTFIAASSLALLVLVGSSVVALSADAPSGVSATAQPGWKTLYGAPGFHIDGPAPAPGLAPLASDDLLPTDSLSLFDDDVRVDSTHDVDGGRGLFGRNGRGSLPEPATWALFIIGFGMIGAAIRGLVVANRRLAKLRSDDPL